MVDLFTYYLVKCGSALEGNKRLIFFKVRARYEKILEEVNRYAPRYMEEMESVFDQSQEEERKRIVFLKQAFLSIHKHLDVTTNERYVTALVVSFVKGLIFCPVVAEEVMLIVVRQYWEELLGFPRLAAESLGLSDEVNNWTELSAN